MTDSEPMTGDPRSATSMSGDQIPATSGSTEQIPNGHPGNQSVDADAQVGDERAEAVQFRAELDDVESALERLDAGTYGTCQVCGVELPDEELEHRPQARSCARHAG